MPHIIVDTPFNKKLMEILSQVQFKMMYAIPQAPGFEEASEESKSAIIASLVINMAVKELSLGRLSPEYLEKVIFVVDQALCVAKNTVTVGIITDQAVKDALTKDILDLESRMIDFCTFPRMVESPSSPKPGIGVVMTLHKDTVFLLPDYVEIARNEILEILRCQIQLLIKSDFVDSFKNKDIVALMLAVNELLAITYLLIICNNFPREMLAKIFNKLELFDKLLLPIFNEYGICGIESNCPVQPHLEKLKSLFTVLGLAEIFTNKNNT